MPSQQPLRAPFVTIDNFLPTELAQGMREAIDDHFSDPFKQAPKTHMVWNYWHVPGLYTYLRTLPESIFGPQMAKAFHDELSGWASENLGLAMVTWPYLSLYVDGCKQEQHNDARNGRYGYVYSLTRSNRKTVGGETKIWRERNYFSSAIHKPASAHAFYETVEPEFNRLLVFDDRVPHAVQSVEGVMDPREGRLVLHGHIYEGEPTVQGGLERGAVLGPIAELVQGYSEEIGENLLSLHGIAVFRLIIRPNGAIANVRVLSERVMKLEGAGMEPRAAVEGLKKRISLLRFELSNEKTTVILPLGFGNRLYEIR